MFRAKPQLLIKNQIFCLDIVVLTQKFQFIIPLFRGLDRKLSLQQSQRFFSVTRKHPQNLQYFLPSEYFSLPWRDQEGTGLDQEGPRRRQQGDRVGGQGQGDRQAAHTGSK